MSNEIPLKTSLYGQSPFKKVPNLPQNIPKLNFYNDRQIYHPNNIQEKYMATPVQFGVNVYFGQPKPNYYPHSIYNPNIQQPQDIYYPYHRENISMCVLFKNSLAKSGYKLTPEQTVQYKDTYKKHSINSFYDNFNYYPISNNNNIINNIYPTFTKVTNVQILSDNDNNKINNEKEKENKKENINSNNNNNKINIKNINDIKKEDNTNINIIINGENNKLNNNNNNNNKKVLFETIGNLNNINPKNLLKKKRLRKNNQQLGLLSKFYTENKNWSKNQIKQISETIGLKENKIYKWLWDQKNKEYKATKFVVNK